MTAWILVMIGGINWLLIGLGGFFGGNWDVVALLLGSWPVVQWLVYIVIGLSGGIDSALTAAVAVGALGAERVHGVSMPSRYSSRGSVDEPTPVSARLRPQR